MGNYRVEKLIDNTYQVIVYTQIDDNGNYNKDVKYQGSLADCEAWIRLTDGGYM